MPAEGSNWRWLVAGLVAAVLVALAAGIATHLASTRASADIDAARQLADSLMDSRQATADSLRRLRASYAADSAEVLRLRAADSVRQRQLADALREVWRWRDSTRWNQAALDSAATAIDSLAAFPPVVASLRATVEAQDTALALAAVRADSLLHALDVAVAAAASLRAANTVQADRIAALERSIDVLRRPERWTARVFGATLSVGGFAGLTTRGPDVGIGVTLRP